MKKQPKDGKALTEVESQFIEQLRGHPEMMIRFQSILEIARQAEGPLKTADEVEELVIQEMRRLGHVTLSQWAVEAEERVGTELQREDPTVRALKKRR